MRIAIAVLADVVVATLLSGIQLAVLWPLLPNRAGVGLVYAGSPLSLALGPGLYVLLRRSGKTRVRLAVDGAIAALTLAFTMAMLFSIGLGEPSGSEILYGVLFELPAIAEAILLMFSEHLIRNLFSRGQR